MPQNFQIRVISLKNQAARRQKIEALFENQNIEWSFFDAISGKDIQPFLHMYDRKKRLQTPGYDLRDNEIACFLSHRAVWEECSQAKTPFLILEDDIKINKNIDGFLTANNYIEKIINAVNEDFLFVRLGNLFPREFKQIIPIANDLKIVRYLRDPSTAMGYLLSPVIAQQLITASEHFFTAVDDFMWRGWEHHCCLFDIYPSLFFTEDEDTPSTIGDRSKPKISLFRKIKREYYRAIDTQKRNSYEKAIVHEVFNEKSKFFK